jgi:hypothetical protein
MSAPEQLTAMNTLSDCLLRLARMAREDPAAQFLGRFTTDLRSHVGDVRPGGCAERFTVSPGLQAWELTIPPSPPGRVRPNCGSDSLPKTGHSWALLGKNSESAVKDGWLVALVTVRQ